MSIYGLVSGVLKLVGGISDGDTMLNVLRGESPGINLLLDVFTAMPAWASLAFVVVGVPTLVMGVLESRKRALPKSLDWEPYERVQSEFEIIFGFKTDAAQSMEVRTQYWYVTTPDGKVHSFFNRGSSLVLGPGGNVICRFPTDFTGPSADPLPRGSYRILCETRPDPAAPAVQIGSAILIPRFPTGISFVYKDEEDGLYQQIIPADTHIQRLYRLGLKSFSDKTAMARVVIESATPKPEGLQVEEALRLKGYADNRQTTLLSRSVNPGLYVDIICQETHLKHPSPDPFPVKIPYAKWGEVQILQPTTFVMKVRANCGDHVAHALVHCSRNNPLGTLLVRVECLAEPQHP